LVVIGKGEVLVEEDEAWREWVGFCERNGLAVGRKGKEEKEERAVVGC
jgi:hypothetical protein